MIIIVNVSEEYYEKIKDAACFGKELLENEGFIHASTCEQFPLIIPRLEKKVAALWYFILIQINYHLL